MPDGSAQGDTRGTDVAVDPKLLAPISPELPTGEDPRPLEEYEAIAKELAKLTGAELDPVDWEMVEASTYDLLTTKTKELKLLAYWAASQFHRDDYPGLARGLSTIAAILDQYSLTLFPTRSKAKIAAMTWLADHIDPLLKPNAEVEPEVWQSCHDAARRCEERYVELELDPGALAKLVRALERLTVLPSEEEVREQAFSQFPEGYGEVGIALLDMANQASPETDVSLRMRRWAMWMQIPRPLGDNRLDCDGGADAIEGIVHLVEERRWDEVLARCEGVFQQFPFALDLTVFTARAAAHALDERCVRAVTGELRGLLTRAPSLALQSDRDGVPLASSLARAWIREQVGDAQDQGQGAGETTIPQPVREHLEAERMDEAMIAASAWITSSTGRTRFARSVALANAFSEFGASEQAFTVFAGLHAHLRSLTVKEWDPVIFAGCLEGYLRCKQLGYGLGPEDGPLLEELSVLDPTSIMSVMPRS